jgi:hypothetical protein
VTDVSRWVEETRAAQGLPRRVQDGSVLDRIAILLRRDEPPEAVERHA